MPKMTEGIAAQARKIQADLQTQVERARANDSLSETGRTRAVAKAYDQALAQITTLRDNFQGGAEISSTEIQRQLFGAASVSGADAISIRDPGDRAAQITTPDEAVALLNRAEMTGDEHLSKAVAGMAFENAQGFLGRPWSAVVDAYTSKRPEVAAQLQQISDARRNSASDSLMNAITLSLPKPTELSAMSDYAVSELAHSTSDAGT